jgi:hypothetical protein
MGTAYVNTASTAGGDGSTNAITGPNRAFPTTNQCILTLWPSDSTVLTSPWDIWCEGSAADTEAVIQGTWNKIITSVANRLKIATTVANRHNGKWDTTKYRWEITDSSIIYNNKPGHVILDGLQGQATCTTSVGGGLTYSIFRLSTQNVGVGLFDCDCRIQNCIAKGVFAGGTDNIGGYLNSPYAETNGGKIRIWNCVASGCTYGYNAAWDQVTHYNCTGWGNNFNFIDPMILRNCLSANPLVGNGYESVGIGGGLSRNNASSDSSTAGADTRVNQTFAFVDTGTLDFDLLETDTGARRRGMFDPSGVMLFTDDIKGNPRDSIWDIGAHAGLFVDLNRLSTKTLVKLQRRGVV